MTDQRMPGEKGIQLLEKARALNPRILRMLATAYSDLEAAIEAVNTGAIYKYVTKPWDIPQLEFTLKRGLEFYIVQKERDHLLKEKMSVLQNMMMTDRLLSLGILATGLSHHIRNSMVAVKTFLDLAPRRLQEENIDLEQMRNPDFWKDYYQKVQGQIEKVVKLLSDLWETSEKPKFEFTAKADLLSTVRAAYESTKGEFERKKVRFENLIPAVLPPLQVDGKKFQRLFELLLREETAGLPAGAQVTVKGRALPGGQEVEMTLEDDGPGLSPEALRSVFDPFFVRGGNPQEFGINLMTCFFIVYHHGGRMSARNRDGKGVTYTLTLPVNPSQKTPVQEEQDFFKRIFLNEAMWEKLTSGE
jgi:two-component system probable response regulator PhcQ